MDVPRELHLLLADRKFEGIGLGESGAHSPAGFEQYFKEVGPSLGDDQPPPSAEALAAAA